jgi:ribosomal protein S18 acetylase RimI-like enzyme
MTQADIPAGLRLCRASGWNQLEADWRCFLDLNPRGCRVAEHEGRVVGTVATLRFENRFAWISMLLVEPEMRHRGIGSMLLQEALRLLEDVETVRLDATPAGKQVYDKFGFIQEYALVRMKVLTSPLATVSGVRMMTAADLPRVLDFDREVFGADRGPILRHLYRSAPEYAFLVESPGISGFVMGRRGYHAEHIGPVVANSVTTARTLLSAPLSRLADRPFLLDVPQHNQEWISWVRSLGFKDERPLIRMYKGGNAPPGLPERQFAISGPEFG